MFLHPVKVWILSPNLMIGKMVGRESHDLKEINVPPFCQCLNSKPQLNEREGFLGRGSYCFKELKVPPFWHYSNFKSQFKRKEGLVGYKEGVSYRIFKCLLSFYGPYWCQVLAWRGGGLARSRSWNRNYHYWLYIVCRSFAKGPPFEVLLVPFSPLFQKKVVPFWSPKETFF